MTRYRSEDLADPGVTEAELELAAVMVVASMDETEPCEPDPDGGLCSICFPDGEPEAADNGAI